MAAPENLNFTEQGASPGTAAGWTLATQNNGVAAADYRGTRTQPYAHEDFDNEWSSVEAWESSLSLTAVAVFDVPMVPGGSMSEDFRAAWDNNAASVHGRMLPGGTEPDWPAPAAGACNDYLLLVDPSAGAGFAVASPPAAPPLADPLPRTGEDFDVGWPGGLSGWLPTPAPAEGGAFSVSSVSTALKLVRVNVLSLDLAAGHGAATGGELSVLLSGLPAALGLNGAWTATATSPTQFSLPVRRSGSYFFSGAVASIQSRFETNLRPPNWAPGTAYLAGEAVRSGGAWWLADNAGTSASGGAGPAGSEPFLDAGPEPIVWSPVRVAPAGPLYAAEAADFGAVPREDFDVGWGVDPYDLTLSSTSTATFRGWDASSPPNPPNVAVVDHDHEGFFRLIAAPIMIALVDVGANLISLVPGKHLQDGARCTFVATPPYSAYGSTYPSPIVPGVSYILWNGAPALGMDRLAVGDDNLALYSAIVLTTNANPLAVQTATPHGLSLGDWVFIYDHLANTPADGFHEVTNVADNYSFEVDVAGAGAGGATGTVYGPIRRLTLATAGAAQLTVSPSPLWDWPAPG